MPDGPAVTCHRLVIPGTGGSVHSNGDLAVTGSADISQDATAAGGFAATGNPTIGGESGGAYGITTFDPIHAIDHLPRADYILQEDGRIVDNMTGSKTKGKTMCNANANPKACKNDGFAWTFADGTGLSDPPARPPRAPGHSPEAHRGTAIRLEVQSLVEDPVDLRQAIGRCMEHAYGKMPQAVYADGMGPATVSIADDAALAA